MKNFTNKILTYILLISFFTSSIITTILLAATNKKTFENYYLTNNTSQNLKIKYEDLIYYTKNIFLYLKNKEKLDNSWFTEKDILHMVDVQNIYKLANLLILISGMLCLLSIIILIIINKKNTLKLIIMSYNTIFLIFLLFIATLTTIILYNFNYFWIEFHKIMFTNDLWLLSPDESNLIKMFPEDFFFLLVKKIVINIIILLLIITAIINILKNFLKRKDNYERNKKAQ